jgi:hypothetical protein
MASAMAPKRVHSGVPTARHPWLSPRRLGRYPVLAESDWSELKSQLEHADWDWDCRQRACPGLR